MKGKKIIKIIGIIILILIVSIIVHTIKNMLIIMGLQNKISRYNIISNYYIKTSSSLNGEFVMNTKYYQKDNRQVVIFEKNQEGKLIKVSMYNNGDRVDTFVDTEDEKTVSMNKDGSILGAQIVEVLHTDNLWQTFLYSIPTRILKNGSNYIIDDFYSPYYMYDNDKTRFYVDKDTGLLMKVISGDMTVEHEYEFDNVGDEVFVEPDIGQYKIQTNNNDNN